ncbi:MAG: Crp/Fnr family transcriptional regulator [Bacteroidota bacterium]
MKSEVIKYILKHVPLSAELQQAVLENCILRTYQKGTVLLKEGAISNENYLVLKGCIRSYYIIDGIEKTTTFYTEEHIVLPSSYGKNTPSEHYLECTEDTTVTVGTPSMEAEMFKKHPELELVFRVLSEVYLSKSRVYFDNYMLSTPEERYLNLLSSRPDLVQRVPQYQIASYLGLTPESLSRLRKRLLAKQKLPV